MLSDFPHGGHPAAVPSSISASGPAEPDLLHALVEDVRRLRQGLHQLVGLIARQPRSGHGRAWQNLHQEIVAARSRCERSLESALEKDRVPVARISLSNAGCWMRSGSVLGRCRRLARDLEEQSAAAAGLAYELGADAVAQALQRCRCELIGLERPLIAANAEETERAVG